MKEPDLGSALVLLPTGIVMIYAAGTPRRMLIKFFAVSGIVAGLFLGDVLFAPPGHWIKVKEYQIRRLLVYVGRTCRSLPLLPEPARPGTSAIDGGTT